MQSQAVQALLLSLALVIMLMRCWVRLRIEHRKHLTLPDYLVWGGWLFTLGWTVCSTIALNIQLTHPLEEPDLTTDSVQYLVVSDTEHNDLVTTKAPYQTVFISCYFFDIGLYFPKFSIVAFYWWLIPAGFRRLRIAVYIATALIAGAFIASLLTDTLIAGPISNNW
jgi:hypothetical protein